MSAKKNDYQIPLSEAELWTTIWRRACRDNCKSFLLHIEDLMGVLTEMGVLKREGKSNNYKYIEGTNRDVRAYMAIDPKRGLPGNGEKVLLVGTKKFPNPKKPGKFIYRDILDGATWLEEGENTGVYDFSRPCPDMCDEDSPLS